MPESILPLVRPCVKCGQADRYATGGCKTCSKAANVKWRLANREAERLRGVAWRAENPEKVKAINNKWYADNPGAHVAYRAANADKVKTARRLYNAANRKNISVRGAAYRAANRDRIAAKSAAWSKVNIELRRVHWQNRRARKMIGGGKLSKGLSEKLFILQKGKCPCCKQPLGDNYHLDHIVPLALGGANIDDNIQLLRAKCNKQKSAKHPVNFMQERGFLI